MLGLLGAALSLTLAPSPDAAPRPELTLRWSAPAACPDAQEVERSVAQRLANRPLTDRLLEVDARVVETEAGYSVTLNVAEAGETTTRSFEALDCGEASQTAALLLAISIDPLADSEPKPEEPKPEEPKPEEPEPPQPEPLVPAPQAPPSDAPEPTQPGPPPEPESRDKRPALLQPPAGGLGLRAHVLGGLGFGPLPTATGLVAGGIGIGGGLWQVEATGEFWTPSVGGESRNREIEVRATLFAFGARGCLVLHPRSLTLPLCAGLAAGQMRAEGLNVAAPDDASSPWVGLRLGPGLVWWPAPWIGLTGRVDGLLTVYRPNFTTSPSGLVHRAGVGGVTALVGVNLRFFSKP